LSSSIAPPGHFWPGGAFAYNPNVATAFRRTGHRVTTDVPAIASVGCNDPLGVPAERMVQRMGIRLHFPYKRLIFAILSANYSPHIKLSVGFRTVVNVT